jgi:hypothetical protein
VTAGDSNRLWSQLPVGRVAKTYDLATGRIHDRESTVAPHERCGIDSTVVAVNVMPASSIECASWTLVGSTWLHLQSYRSRVKFSWMMAWVHSVRSMTTSDARSRSGTPSLIRIRATSFRHALTSLRV